MHYSSHIRNMFPISIDRRPVSVTYDPPGRTRTQGCEHCYPPAYRSSQQCSKCSRLFIRCGGCVNFTTSSTCLDCTALCDCGHARENHFHCITCNSAFPEKRSDILDYAIPPSNKFNEWLSRYSDRLCNSCSCKDLEQCRQAALHGLMDPYMPRDVASIVCEYLQLQ